MLLKLKLAHVLKVQSPRRSFPVRFPGSCQFLSVGRHVSDSLTHLKDELFFIYGLKSQVQSHDLVTRLVTSHNLASSGYCNFQLLLGV